MSARHTRVSVLFDRIVFHTRYRITRTDILANRLQDFWNEAGLIPPNRLWEFQSLSRLVTNTVQVEFGFHDSNGIPVEILDFQEFWLWLEANIVVARLSDGTPAEITQNPELLKELIERYELTVGVTIQVFWWDAYEQAQASYAPKPATSIAAPETLTPEQRNDPNLEPPAEDTETG